MQTQISPSDPCLVAIAAYLAGDVDGVQAAFAPLSTLLDSIYEGQPMPSSECSPCFDQDDTLVSVSLTLPSY